jgi:16S rRNA (guanine1207-N2)-methyltransferase
MDLALETLVYGLNEMRAPQEKRVLFLNARVHRELPVDISAVQWFKPYYDVLSASERYARVEEVKGSYEAAYILFPKNVVEGRYLIAQAVRLVGQGGMIYVSAENKVGGNRLQKIVQQFGAEIVQQISKNKSRFVAFENSDIDQGVVDAVIEEGSFKTVDKTGVVAQAGVYGWNKIDKGSQILLQHIPQDLKGKIADFGCGYGYLLQHILQQNDGIKTAHAIDADARALVCARENIGEDGRVEYLWSDLTAREGIPFRLDAIIMNPPFHEGKKADSDIGASFIKTASQSLKRNGALYMVANNQLPYEAVLNEAFFSVELLAQENGFKVFKAIA